MASTATNPPSSNSLATAVPIASPDHTNPSAQLTAIRVTLKEWEKSFAIANTGRKPSREDIKRDDSGIGQVYKEYNRLRDIVEGKPVTAQGKGKRSEAQELEQRRSLKRRRDKEESGAQRTRETTSLQKDHIVSTPHKIKHLPQRNESPSSETPRPLKSFIGPTPQRDGKVLGLFDLLSTGGSKDTPTTGRKRKAEVLAEGNGNIVQTPSRKRGVGGDIHEHLDEEHTPNTGRRQKFQRTPASEGKKFLLSQFFATPSTARFMDQEPEEQQSLVGKTPLRTRLLAGRDGANMDMPEHPGADSTPPFLRRTTSSFSQKLVASTSAEPSSFPPSQLSFFKKGRSLSEIVKSLRQVQDEEHDDDMDALNEIEAAEHCDVSEDSQNIDGQEPQRIWKKRGQKRTTKRVNMKPPKVKPKAKDSTDQQQDESDDELASVNEETQMPSAPDESELERPTGNPTKQSKTMSENKTRSVKANAISHMNFRSLKIKNKNTKAKGRGFGRSGRR